MYEASSCALCDCKSAWIFRCLILDSKTWRTKNVIWRLDQYVKIPAQLSPSTGGHWTLKLHSLTWVFLCMCVYLVTIVFSWGYGPFVLPWSFSRYTKQSSLWVFSQPEPIGREILIAGSHWLLPEHMWHQIPNRSILKRIFALPFYVRMHLSKKQDNIKSTYRDMDCDEVSALLAGCSEPLDLYRKLFFSVPSSLHCGSLPVQHPWRFSPHKNLEVMGRLNHHHPQAEEEISFQSVSVLKFCSCL